MNILFHPEAENELNQAINYYEACEKGLGTEFLNEIYKGIELISNYPGVWPLLSTDIRRYLINRFPYGIIYGYIKDEVFILAIMQLNRRPFYWKERKSVLKNLKTKR